VAVKPIEDPQRVRVDVPPRDGMLLSRHDERVHDSGLYEDLGRRFTSVAVKTTPEVVFTSP